MSQKHLSSDEPLVQSKGATVHEFITRTRPSRMPLICWLFLGLLAFCTGARWLEGTLSGPDWGFKAPIVLLGDSITEWAFSTREQGWAMLLGTHFRRNRDIINRGIGGSTTETYKPYFADALQTSVVEGKAPAVVTVFFGANDALLPDAAPIHVPLEKFRANLVDYVNYIRSRFTRTKVVLITPPPVIDSRERLANFTRRYRDAVVSVGSELDCPVMDVWQLFFGPGATYSADVAWTYLIDASTAMDIVLNFTDPVFDGLYGSVIPEPYRDHFTARDAIPRQLSSLFLILLVGGSLLYFLGAGLNFHFLFDKETMNHPKFLKNQIAREIWLSVTSLPRTALVTIPWFFFELRGYSKLYDKLEHWWHLPLQALWFLAFTDCLVYWIHRGFHHPWMYSWLHKPHHTWKVTTPFAALAFHSLPRYQDGYGQSVPYHLFAYLFPMWKPLYLGMFVFVQLWTISIHDGVYISNDEILLSAAHHNIHHLEFNYNYGQYTTLWDRIGGSYKKPEAEFKNEMFFHKLRMRKQAAAKLGGVEGQKKSGRGKTKEDRILKSSRVKEE
ncbi:Lathosterol oxidase [Irineochytrium annulatum]|nr:Lathosterol oxidase [Irineochytrium annulatum]